MLLLVMKQLHSSPLGGWLIQRTKKKLIKYEQSLKWNDCMLLTIQQLIHPKSDARLSLPSRNVQRTSGSPSVTYSRLVVGMVSSSMFACRRLSNGSKVKACLHPSSRNFRTTSARRWAASIRRRHRHPRWPCLWPGQHVFNTLSGR